MRPWLDHKSTSERSLLRKASFHSLICIVSRPSFTSSPPFPEARNLSVGVGPHVVCPQASVHRSCHDLETVLPYPKVLQVPSTKPAVVIWQPRPRYVLWQRYLEPLASVWPSSWAPIGPVLRAQDPSFGACLNDLRSGCNSVKRDNAGFGWDC